MPLTDAMMYERGWIGAKSSPEESRSETTEVTYPGKVLPSGRGVPISRKNHGHGWDEVVERLVEEANRSPDLRYLALICHLYADHYMDVLLDLKLPNPRPLRESSMLQSFHNKVLILDSLGVLDSRPEVSSNLHRINTIRNHFAHNLMMSDEPDKKTREQIRQMSCLNFKGQKEEPDTLWNQILGGRFRAQFNQCAMDTITALQIMIHEIETGKPFP